MKKGLLSFLVPLFFLSCSSNKNLPFDEVYERRDESREIQKEDSIVQEEIVGGVVEVSYFPRYSYFYFSRDSDFDGIEDWSDPWPYVYGPYVDMDGNGFLSCFDMRVGGYYGFEKFSHNHFYYYNLGNPHWYSFYHPPFFNPNPSNNVFYGPRRNFSGSGNIPPEPPVSPPQRPIRKITPETNVPVKKYPLQNNSTRSPREYHAPSRNPYVSSSSDSAERNFDQKKVYSPKKTNSKSVETNPSIKIKVYNPPSNRESRSLYSSPSVKNSSSSRKR